MFTLLRFSVIEFTLGFGCDVKWDRAIETTSVCTHTQTTKLNQESRVLKGTNSVATLAACYQYLVVVPGRAAAACNLICSRQTESPHNVIFKSESIPTTAVSGGPWAPPASPGVCWFSLSTLVSSFLWCLSYSSLTLLDLAWASSAVDGLYSELLKSQSVMPYWAYMHKEHVDDVSPRTNIRTLSTWFFP